jgi:hypothetical protein
LNLELLHVITISMSCAFIVAGVQWCACTVRTVRLVLCKKPQTVEISVDHFLLIL